ncbi:MAG: HD domain-containing protein [Campylobacterales bacterium]|nr:HD domain-containing protein [Campylobacterales bacterium]
MKQNIWGRLKVTEILLGLIASSETSEVEQQYDETTAINKIRQELSDTMLSEMFDIGIDAGLASLFSIALLDMKKYSFKTISSIPEKQRDYIKDFNNFAKLKRVNLLEHTYNVVKQAQSMKAELGYNYPTLLILCLLHDFGKSKDIKQNYASENWSLHEQISANYLKHVLLKLNFDEKFIVTLTEILNHHHDDSKPTRDKLTQMLKKCDSFARIDELDKLSSY